MNRLASHVRQTSNAVVFDPGAYEVCLNAATDQLQRIVHELLLRRRKLDVTQQDLAAALDMRQSRISEIERLSSGDISLMRLLLISEALGVRLELRVAEGDSAIFKPIATTPAINGKRPFTAGGVAVEEHPEVGKKGDRNFAYIALSKGASGDPKAKGGSTKDASQRAQKQGAGKTRKKDKGTP